MRIFYYVRDFSPSCWYRCYLPALALKGLGHEVYVEDEFSLDWLDEIDILVIQRYWSSRTLLFIEEAIEKEIPVVNDIDENFWNLPVDHIEYEFWKEEDQVKFYNAILKRCWMLTVPNEALKKEVESFHKNVKILPSALPGELWESAYKKRKRYLKKREDNKVVIGWAGSPLSCQNLELIKEPLEHILNKYENVEVHILGAPEFATQHPQVKIFSEWVRMEFYPERLIHFDIGLFPLLPDRYNRAKSDVKYLEYSYLAIPSVSSPFAGHEGVVKQAENGFIAESSTEWVQYLSRLIEDRELREKMGKKARRVALNRTIERNINQWVETYEKAIEEFKKIAPSMKLPRELIDKKAFPSYFYNTSTFSKEDR